MDNNRTSRWQQIVAQIAAEYRLLPDEEKSWINVRLDQIQQLQVALQALFDNADGTEHCRDCEGDCCARGHHHMTLVNLLGFLRANTLPPDADFTQTCPFLSWKGCLLPVTERPYNCISFICDKIEANLRAEELERFYQLEKQLRALYFEFSDRYLGAAMTGLLLQDQRLSGRSFFTFKERSA